MMDNISYKKFIELIDNQGGKLPIPSNKKIIRTNIFAPKNGYIHNINTYELGKLLVELGGGRKYKEQEINYDVGMIIKVKINEYVKENDLLFEVYSSSPLTTSLKQQLLDTITISNKKRKKLKTVYKIL